MEEATSGRHRILVPRRTRRDHDESQAIQAELYEQIGRLKMEVEWLKKKAARFG
jgi:transposase